MNVSLIGPTVPSVPLSSPKTSVPLLGPNTITCIPLPLQGVPEKIDLLVLFNHLKYIAATKSILNFLRFVVHPGYFTYHDFSETICKPRY